MFFDVVIIGAGPVGMSLAIVLASQGYRTLIVEKHKLAERRLEDLHARTLALSCSSVSFFKALGLWEKLQHNAVPIYSVQVSVKGQYGTACLRPTDRREALGYVIGAERLEQVLFSYLKQMKQASIYDESQLVQADHQGTHWVLQLAGQAAERVVHTGLLVGAQGMQAQVLGAQPLLYRERDYQQVAVVGNVQVQGAKSYHAIERFLPEGAIALLPWHDNYFTMIWTLETFAAQRFNKATPEVWLHACQNQLGMRLGKFIISGQEKLQCFPLKAKQAQVQKGARWLLMGNAAHSLHPIAAQGLNLSVRDLWRIRMLTQVGIQQDLGSESFLEAYWQGRSVDQACVTLATDAIARFVSGGPFPVCMRALGVTLLDTFSPLKRVVTAYGMGEIRC